MPFYHKPAGISIKSLGILIYPEESHLTACLWARGREEIVSDIKESNDFALA